MLTVFAVLAAVLAIVGGLVKGARAVVAAIVAVRDLIKTIEGNTDATGDLADEFRAHRDQVAQTLAAHERRLITLERA